GWRVLTTDGRDRTFPRVVLAAGLHTTALVRDVGGDLPLFGVRGHVLLTTPLPPLLKRIIAWAGSGAALASATGLTLGTLADRTEARTPAVVAALLHQREDGRVALGASWSSSLWPEEADTTQRIARAGIRLVPALAEATVEASWSGVRPATADGLPVIDEIASGLHVCCGHGGLGFTAGPGSAELLTETMLGRSRDEAIPFAARRLSRAAQRREKDHVSR
ncbi:NAD(P)/FAD-dependent oxidoreductase, partial [Actinocorallia lasiicapitis]